MVELASLAVGERLRVIAAWRGLIEFRGAPLAGSRGQRYIMLEHDYEGLGGCDAHRSGEIDFSNY